MVRQAVERRLAVVHGQGLTGWERARLDTEQVRITRARHFLIVALLLGILGVLADTIRHRIRIPNFHGTVHRAREHALAARRVARRQTAVERQRRNAQRLDDAGMGARVGVPAVLVVQVPQTDFWSAARTHLRRHSRSPWCRGVSDAAPANRSHRRGHPSPRQTAWQTGGRVSQRSSHACIRVASQTDAYLGPDCAGPGRHHRHAQAHGCPTNASTP